MSKSKQSKVETTFNMAGLQAADASIVNDGILAEALLDELSELDGEIIESIDDDAIEAAAAKIDAAEPPAADDADLEVEATDKPAKAKKAKAPKAPKEPKAPRVTSITHQPGDRLVALLGDKSFIHFSLSEDAAANETRVDEFVKAMNTRDAIADKVKRALDMVQLGHLSDRMPGQLSGGQQQRVALARALVFEPRVVLMDEPLGALDKQLREQMQLDIRDLHHRLGLTILFVTHDQDEALTMSDRIAVFNAGKIQQCASPREVYDRPANRFVAEFIGETNLISGTLRSSGPDGHAIALPDGTVLTAEGSADLSVGAAALLSLRPERIEILPADAADGTARNRLSGEILDTVYQGDHLRVVIDTAVGRLIARTGRKVQEWPVGAKVVLTFRTGDGWVIAA